MKFETNETKSRRPQRWIKGAITVAVYDNEPLSVLVSGSSEAYIVNVAPQDSSVEVEIGRTLEIAGAAHGNIVEYYEDGTELMLPIITDGTIALTPGIGSSNAKFNDVRPNDWFNSAVASVASVGIIEGIGSNRFDPHGKLTTAQLIAMLMRTQYGRMSGGNSWYAPYIEQAQRDGILFASDSLDPNVEITRAQAALIITRYIERFNPNWTKNRVSGSPNDIANVPNEYRSSVEKAYSWNLVSGDANNIFNPHSTLTRAEAAQILYNYYSIVD